jgi:streptogramin lyase
MHTLQDQSLDIEWAKLPTFAAPVDLCIDSSGNVYCLNSNNASGNVYCLKRKKSSGNVYCLDNIKSSISKITSEGIVTTDWVKLASGSNPTCIAIDHSGNIFTSNENYTVSKITPTRIVTPDWVNFISDRVGISNIVEVMNMCINTKGDVFLALSNKKIVKISANGTVRYNYAKVPFQPDDMKIDGDGNLFVLYMDENLQSIIAKIPASGPANYTWANVGIGVSSVSMVINSSGDIFVVNNGSNNVSKITSSAFVIQSWASLSTTPNTIAIDAKNNIYVGNKNGTISKITSTAAVTPSWATTGGSMYVKRCVINNANNVMYCVFESTTPDFPIPDVVGRISIP